MLRDDLDQRLILLLAECMASYKTIKETAQAVIALIEGERCTWTKQIEDNHEYYTTECDLVDLAYHTYCPKCGKRIEVKDED